jgi:hypothetical protein
MVSIEVTRVMDELRRVTDELRALERRIERMETGKAVMTQPVGKPSLQENSLLVVLDELANGNHAVHSEPWQSEAVRRGFVSSTHAFRAARSRLAKRGFIKREGRLTWKL